MGSQHLRQLQEIHPVLAYREHFMHLDCLNRKRNAWLKSFHSCPAPLDQSHHGYPRSHRPCNRTTTPYRSQERKIQS